MVVWVLVAFVLGASAFAAYRLTRYLYRAEPPAPIAAAPVEAPAEIKKPAFSVGGDLAGTELNIPEPELSFEAARSGAAGPITVKVRVNKNGRVISAATSSGDRRLRAAAVKAARQATFAPDKLAGLSSRSRVVSGTITYEFQPAPPSIDTSANTSNTNEIPTTTTPATNTDPNAPVVSDTLANAVKNIPAADYPAAARRANASGTIISDGYVLPALAKSFRGGLHQATHNCEPPQSRLPEKPPSRPTNFREAATLWGRSPITSLPDTTLLRGDFLCYPSLNGFQGNSDTSRRGACSYARSGNDPARTLPARQ